MFAPKDSLQKVWSDNRPLYLLVLFAVSCLAISLAALALDPKLINGERAWIKPCKFSLSLTIYGLTLIWLSPFLTNHKILFKRVSIAACIATIIELSAIILQVLRGTTSHFNTNGLLNQTIFVITIGAIIPIAVGTLAVFVMLLREKDLPPVLGLALRWGVALTVVGFIPGILMLVPDPLQDVITSFKQFDGHTVGFPEGGPGLPVIGWSTVAGDLRPAHFLGIHALQILPLFGLAILKFLPSLSEARKELLIWNVGLTYLGIILVLTFQALSAEPLLEPGYLTMLFGSFILTFSLVFAIGTLLLPVERESGIGVNSALEID
jgi:hypothetical protein